MPPTDPQGLEVVIFGGGGAGLWLLDELVSRGIGTLLLEAGDLGGGQTIASQGIIHGGLKYTLSGLLTPSAQTIKSMPERWRRCLAGEGAPDLRGTRLRAEYCHLWQTTSLRSRLSMIGARAGLRTAPVRIDRHARPPVLARCPGLVARLDEQVIEPASLVTDLARRHPGPARGGRNQPHRSRAGKGLGRRHRRLGRHRHAAHGRPRAHGRWPRRRLA